MAFLWSVSQLLPDAPRALLVMAAEVPGALGTCTPRANPRPSHSCVTPVHRPVAEFWTSTSSQPLTRGHSAWVAYWTLVAVPPTVGGKTKLGSPPLAPVQAVPSTTGPPQAASPK